ncbi:hypothetical protein SAMN02949497_1522 [Methylomagnum ishizawai]|uniref:Uncharacterized protein n=1 Tax=Methylomagnum ishizawai TaxID=1760988 RepID=A0A1Y6D062_9GAMM|nr:hypothetical protein [Methylomagnum ishizawai]SMF94213.1 hypothetical protein SAMN02949497_1522 [Methylomagnum ishizawai]
MKNQKSLMVFSVAFIIVILYFFSGIYKHFKQDIDNIANYIYLLVFNVFIITIIVLSLVVFIHKKLEEYGSHWSFITEALIVVLLIGIFIEVPHVNHFLQEGVMETIREELNKHDASVLALKNALIDREDEIRVLRNDKSNISAAQAEINSLKNNLIALRAEKDQLKEIIKMDYLVGWEIETKNALERCGECRSNLPDNCQCKRIAIKESINSSPIPNEFSIPKYDKNGVFDNSLIFSRMGYIYLVYASDLLKLDLGVDRATFKGNGISSPPVDSSMVGIPEYWAPNKNDGDGNVITCSIVNSSSKDTGRKVGDILQAARKPSGINDNKAILCKNIQQAGQAIRYSKNRDRPALFRCHKFPSAFYKNTVGRPEAKRVFFSRLSDVFDLSIAEACTKTGRNLSGQANQEETLFVWIFIPDDPQEVISATWENLIKKYGLLVGF